VDDFDGDANNGESLLAFGVTEDWSIWVRGHACSLVVQGFAWGRAPHTLGVGCKWSMWGDHQPGALDFYYIFYIFFYIFAVAVNRNPAFS
jgi:hypothetical protein